MTVVVTLVTRASKPDQKVRVTPLFFMRDLITLLIVFIYVLVHLVFIGYINLWSGLGFFVIYLSYVASMLISNRIGRQDKDLGLNGILDEDEQDKIEKPAMVVMKD